MLVLGVTASFAAPSRVSPTRCWWKHCEDEHLVDRSVFAEVPLRVEYELTDKARRLCQALGAVDDWAQREAGPPGAANPDEAWPVLHAPTSTRRTRHEAV